jgi:hypothetical protein
MKKLVEVVQMVEVDIPDSLLTEKFMAEFRKDFYEFDTQDAHFKHIGQLAARGIIHSSSFIEGYGPADKIGIKFNVESTDASIL